MIMNRFKMTTNINKISMIINKIKVIIKINKKVKEIFR